MLAEHLAIRTLALPEILGRAGYHRIWVTGSDPSFDNIQHWTRRWYDRWEFVDGGDERLVKRLIALDKEAPADGPRLLSLYTYTTHPPYAIPGEPSRPEDPDEAYARALHFADGALGLLFDELRKSGRLDRAVVIVTGDHAQPNAWQLANESALGLPHAGHTWTGLLLAAPGIAGGAIREEAVSHVDVAPTVLAALGIKASQHFLGLDLRPSPPPRRRALSVLYGGSPSPRAARAGS